MSSRRPRPARRLSLGVIRHLYRTFGPHLRPYWRWFVLAYAGLASTVLLNLLKPWPMKLIVDHVLLDRPLPARATWLAPALTTDKLTLLTALCLAIVLVVFFEGLFGFTNKYFMTRAGQSVLNDIRRHVFDHLQFLPQAFHGSSRSGDLVLRLTSDIDALRYLLIKAVESFTGYVLVLVGVTTTMFVMDWRLTLVALTVVPPLYFMSVHFAGRVRALTYTKRRKESDVASIVQETMTSMAVVQAFSQERQETERFAKASSESLTAELKRLQLARLFNRGVQLITATGTALVVWYGARRALAGALTPGDLIVFAAYMKDLYGPITGFSGLIMDFSSSLVSSERIAEILRVDLEVKDEAGAIDAPPLKGAVSFEHVTFGYRPGSPVLHNLSFTVKPGQMVALVGSSGTGKSTVVNLLVRFYDPWNGRILIDGADIRRFTLRSLRSQMSVVFQESVLFRRTIRENIAYGSSEATFDQVVTAATAARVHEFISTLPDGYETVLDERAKNISGGQRQRLALARALLRNAPILILDEPVTGVDAITEAQLNETLRILLEGTTTFMIAHRLGTIQKADLILVIEEGTVIEQGTHAELLASSRLYRHFYDLQSREFATGAQEPTSPL